MTKHVRIRILLALGALLGASLAVVAAPSATADGEPQVTVDDITVYEPHFGESASLDFTVTLDSATSSPLTVPWEYYKGKYYGSASALSHGDLVFEAGETVKTLSFPLAFDPNDDVKPYYRTVKLVPDWRNVDQFGVATIIDTTRNGQFLCDATAYETTGAGPTGVPTSASSGEVHGDDCHAGVLNQSKASYDRAHVTVVDASMGVVQYADNSVLTQPAAGDGGEAHVELRGVVWRVAPGLVLRVATLKADARIVCTAVGELPSMEASSSVTGLRINGAPPMGTITDERTITLNNGNRIVLNRHLDQALTIAGGPQMGEPHRTINQDAIKVNIDAGLQNQQASLGSVMIGQLFGNTCAS